MQAFRDRILKDLLPTFCNDPSRSWTADGFKEEWNKITKIDAEDFLRGIDGGLIRHMGRGLYRAPRSYASEQFFWSGRTKKVPRPITLWVEPIITVATLARLHYDLGWPEQLLGTQSKNWAFDVVTYLSNDSDVEYIACEVKKSEAEVCQLVELMNQFGKSPRLGQKATPKQRNAYRKFDALRSNRVPFFWAVGPGGLTSCYAFRVGYAEKGGLVSFQKIANQELAYSKLRLSLDHP